MSTHHHTVRVYWEDTDAGGIVYHSNYLKFAERGRSEFVRSKGIIQSDLAQNGFGFTVTGLNIKFLRAARLDDLLDVQTCLLSVGAARLRLQQVIWRMDQTKDTFMVKDDIKNEELVRLDVELAYIKLGGKATKISSEIKKVLLSHIQTMDSPSKPQQR